MMNWDWFIYFAIASVLFWIIGSWNAFKEFQMRACTFTFIGLLIFGIFIGLLWYSLERPPLRTMGETRLWYSFFLPLAGLITYMRWRYKWILGFSTILSVVFICVNILKPEIHNKALMPALQKPMVCSSCHYIHVCLCYAWGFGYNGNLSFMDKKIMAMSKKWPCVITWYMSDCHS